MKKIEKKTISVIIALSLLSVTLMPMRASAVVPPLLDFGGITIFPVICPCSASAWVWLAPLYLGSVPVTGFLDYVPYATLLFGNFIPPVVPAAPHLGGFIPGVPGCWFFVGVACIPLPSLGTMGFVGSGLPGGI